LVIYFVYGRGGFEIPLGAIFFLFNEARISGVNSRLTIASEALKGRITALS